MLGESPGTTSDAPHKHPIASDSGVVLAPSGTQPYADIHGATTHRGVRLAPQCTSALIGTTNMSTTTKPHVGDKVEWTTSQGKTTGKVVRKITGTAHVHGHTAKASRAEPQYEVQSAKTGKHAIHKAAALKPHHG